MTTMEVELTDVGNPFRLPGWATEFARTICIGLIILFLTILLLQGKISPDGFVVGAGTFLLAMATFHLANTERAESRQNRRQDRDLAARERAISNYPLLSQKIDLEFPSQQISVHGIDEASGLHYKLIIKNYGKGPAINQDRVYYRFFQRGRQVHQNNIPITGAHDIIAPGDNRPLNMTELCRSIDLDDWDSDIEKKYDTIWVRLPHEDIQRNECCNCTKYVYDPKLKGKFGKRERHWYFSSYPEISSERCKECDWRAQEDATE